MSNKKSFKDTLNLPKTDFSIRANSKDKEPELLKRWQKEELYRSACEAVEKGKNKKFILHDGPPFANGHIHMGHVLNRVLKDIVCKVKRMSGYDVVSVPGWDCHGLPIELKVMQEGDSDNDRIMFKKKCREYAQKWIDIQKEEIQRLGVITDWHHPYITMSPGYEASILKSFATFVEKGYIERKGKTVPWCASCKTVLATAEIEHKDKKDPSCYILFSLEKEAQKKLFPKLSKEDPDLEINLLVWTTTPWTIPLNRAVLLHPKADYVVLQGKNQAFANQAFKKQAFIVAESLADAVCKEIGIEKKVLAKISSKKLKDKLVSHPYIKNTEGQASTVPIILDDMVMLEEGTACVHTAPGCGPEDYLIGIKNDLEIFSPLSVDGKYTEGIQPKELEGMSVFDGQIWSIKKMHEVGRLLHKSSITHSYPHCWRCHKPLIFRATDQWFCDLQHNKLAEKAIDAANSLEYVPDWGKNRLSSSIASRTEWCLSRQRQWGVPIPAIMCGECGHAHLKPEFIRSVAEFVAKEGVEFWDRVTIEELLQAGVLPRDFSCKKCGNKDKKNFTKEMDILDVWFESGVSHAAVKEQCPSLTMPADVYLEGSDQHRGWFQSSLLSSMVMYDKPCTKSFVTHAYVLDAQAQKMSKSKGNVVSPQDVIDRYSADILRLWVASSDFEGNIVVSDEILKNVSEVYRKIRNTCRFMISNLYDFDITKDAVSIENLPALDKYALATLKNINDRVHDSYEKYWFTDVFNTINKYCTNDLSSFYLDIIKDRLYTEKADGHLRRSAQTVMYNILHVLTHLVAPVLSFLAEEVSDFYCQAKDLSIHLEYFPELPNVWSIATQKQKQSFMHVLAAQGVKGDAASATFESKIMGWWNLLEHIRPELLKAIESKREVGLVKHSLESKVTAYLDESIDEVKVLNQFISYIKESEDINRFFKDFIIVSQFEFVKSPDGLDKTGLPWLHVKVEHAEGTKCPRCWQWDTVLDEDGLCRRCVLTTVRPE